MALSSFSKLCFLAAFVLFSSLVSTTYARDFSIVGYSPDDLTCINKLTRLFESWIQKHGKMYKSIEEKLHRFEIFKDNLKHIDERNKVITNYWLGLNVFADLSHEEFKNMYLGLKPDQVMTKRSYDQSAQEFKYRDVEDIPESLDWRARGAVAKVKDQGQCGSCWAFSTVAAVEGINQIVTGNLTTLSEQELLDCDTMFNDACNGGLMDYGFEFIASNGICKEDAYPYKAEKGRTCKLHKGKFELFTISGYEDVPENDEESLLKALANQPLSVAIDASKRDFQLYKAGVYDGDCESDLDHGVTAVGYGPNFIIVKNSWGPGWGENGYINIMRSTSKTEGMCGINKMASYPTKNN